MSITKGFSSLRIIALDLHIRITEAHSYDITSGGIPDIDLELLGTTGSTHRLVQRTILLFLAFCDVFQKGFHVTLRYRSPLSHRGHPFCTRDEHERHRCTCEYQDRNHHRHHS